MRMRNSYYRPLQLVALACIIVLPGCSEDSQQPETVVTIDSQQSAKAELTLWPSSDEVVGATLLIKGEDFTGDCGVQIFLNGDSDEPLGSSDIGSDGTFSVQTEVPSDTSTGTHMLNAQGLTGTDCNDPSNNLATASINIKPALPILLIDTIEARPGSTVQVSGYGFCADTACSSVTLFADGAISAEGIEVIADGSFIVTARVPAVDNAGEIMVVAVQTDADGATLRGFGDLFLTVRPAGIRPVIL